MIGIEQIDEVLSNLPKNLQGEVLACIEQREVVKSTQLVSIGSVCQHLYFIKSGLLRTFYISEKGKEVNIEFSPEGQFITSITSFYNSMPSHVAIESIEESILLRLSRHKLYDLYDKHPVINKLGRLVTEQNFVRREQWHATKYSLGALERYKGFMRDFPGLVNRIPLNHLASFLGVTKEHLSRIRAAV